jgi:hypothetical protein
MKTLSKTIIVRGSNFLNLLTNINPTKEKLHTYCRPPLAYSKHTCDIKKNKMYGTIGTYERLNMVLERLVQMACLKTKEGDKLPII